MRQAVAGAFLAFLALASPAGAATCAAPQMLASLPLHDDGLDGFSVPVSINGEERRVKIWLGPHTALAGGLFAPGDIKKSVNTVDGVLTQIRSATVHELKIGAATATDIELDVNADQPKPDEEVGLLGTGIFANFDMEIDFPAAKLNLYRHEDCPGAGVGWKPDAVIPFDLSTLHKLTFPMTLDGKTVTASMRFDMFGDRMPFTSAAAIFGLTADDPRLQIDKPDRSYTLGGLTLSPADLTVRRFAFDRLSSGDLVIAKPTVTLEGKPDGPVCDGKTVNQLGHGVRSVCWGYGDLALGLTTLRKLKMYFAFQDGMLYLAGPK